MILDRLVIVIERDLVDQGDFPEAGGWFNELGSIFGQLRPDHGFEEFPFVVVEEHLFRKQVCDLHQLIWTEDVDLDIGTG